MTTRKAKRAFSFSGSSPLTPARRIYDELEAGDSLSQSPAAKRAKRSGRREKAPYHPTMAAVMDGTSSEADGSGSTDKDSSLHSLSDSYNIKLAEVAGTERKHRLTKSNIENHDSASPQGPKHEPSIFNPIPVITMEPQDTPTKIKQDDNHTKTKKHGSPSKKKRDGSLKKANKDHGSPVKTTKDVRFSTGAFELAPETDKMDLDNSDENVDAVKDIIDDAMIADGLENRIPSPPLHTDHESQNLPSGTKTLKSINKRLKSLDAKLSTTAPAETYPLPSEEVAAIQHLQEDVMSLSQRIHRDEIRAQVRHQIMFNSLKALASTVNSLTEEGKEKVGEAKGQVNNIGGKAKKTLQIQTLERCLDKYTEELGRASSAEEVLKFGTLCVKYAGDLFKTL
ncbi:hypothetical protein QBC43DRAFT_356186 [Cladorrhinum sp. PSN259]|nr:hypothetical protein QBC43DRAFT_356186 [Cladorrhinum sp. PSN259]